MTYIFQTAAPLYEIKNHKFNQIQFSKHIMGLCNENGNEKNICGFVFGGLQSVISSDKTLIFTFFISDIE